MSTSTATCRAAPTVGAPAPDAELRDASGAPVCLSALWSGASGGAALVFLRHFG